MEKSNTSNYLLFIILFSVILFVCTNKSKNNVTEKFNDITIADYIEDNTKKLLDEKREHEFNSTKEELKNLPEYKNGIKSRELKNKMEKFNNRLNELSNVNIEDANDIIEDTEKYINSIEDTDKDIYNKFIIEYYKEHEDKVFDKEKLFNEVFNKIETHSSFQDTNSKNRNDDIDIETFLGKYFIPPYQYNKFDNVYMLLSKKNNLNFNEFDNYIMSFYVLDELVFDFEVELIKKKENLLNLNENITTTSDDLKNNILGYEITINKELPNKTLQFKYPKYRNDVKNILNQIGVKENMKLYIFIVDNQFNKQYLNMDGSIEGMSEDAYFHKDVDDLFRIYSKNGATLLHLSKKNTIDKPFKSLIS